MAVVRATVYSQVERDDLPSNVAKARNALSSASCAMSSASCQLLDREHEAPHGIQVGPDQFLKGMRIARTRFLEHLWRNRFQD
jgi:hypothetical protein